jgi:nucleoside-diphosphate-sugar epimerase
MWLERILITGGNGFIGTHIARHLLHEGNFVRVVDINPNEFMLGKYCSEELRLDLRKWRNCLAATKEMDKVYNLAANMGGIGFITKVGADVMRDNSLMNTYLLEACRRNKTKRYFYSSSACVYPTYRQTDPDVKGLKEDDAYPADPDNFYGWEKLLAEKVCEAYQRDYGLDIRIARYHNIYGPEGTYKGGREKSPAALCRKVADASNPGEIVVWGDGKQTRSYCYIDDCVRGTVMLMESEYEKPMNIGSERLVTVDELADMIIRISGKTVTQKYDLNAPQGVRGRNADITLARKVLGWEPQVSLEEGLAKTYKWIEAHCKSSAHLCS